MKYLVTSQEMKMYDANTIERVGIPGMVLMERAALAVFQEIEFYFMKHHGAKKSVFILAGVGNNGGDGLALARLLAEAGYLVCVECVGNTDKASMQWKEQRKILENAVGEIVTGITGRIPQNVEYTVWVDALFGVGLCREVVGEYAQAVEHFNLGEGYKISVDVPSGLHADNGRILGCAIKADVTVTFGFCKRGLVMYPGREYAGRVEIAPVGITEKSFFGTFPKMVFHDELPIELLPSRKPDGNKGTFGKVLLVAGGTNMAGAAILSARAAYRAGAGMVKVISLADNRRIIQEALPEALFGAEENLEEGLKWASVVAIGPGLGKEDWALRSLEKVIQNSSLPLLIDADGLNLLAEEETLQRKLSLRDGKIILTPHVGELSRLTHKDVSVLKQSLHTHVNELAEKLGVVVVAKDACTFTCEAGKPICVNSRGNSGMATAGSGDVLAGIIAGLLAQGMSAYEASSVGVHIHALAGESAAQQMGEHGLMAGDLIYKIGKTEENKKTGK